jgi:hypothetical protein
MFLVWQFFLGDLLIMIIIIIIIIIIIVLAVAVTVEIYSLLIRYFIYFN